MKTLIVHLAVVAFLFCSLSAAPTAARTWYILPDGTGDATTIQAGLDSCLAGDSVLVAAGTYYENLTWPAVDSIVLMSESGAAATIIDGGGSGRVMSITSGVNETAVIDGFTIMNGVTSAFGGGILCDFDCSPTIVNNKIMNCDGLRGGGIACDNGASPLIQDNEIIQNSANSGGGVFSGWGESAPTITRNLVKNNDALNGAGIYFTWQSVGICSDNDVVENAATNNGGGIRVGLSGVVVSNNRIIGNTALNDGCGIHCGGGDGTGVPRITQNTISHNCNLEVPGAGLSTSTGANSTALIEYCEISNNFGVGVSCEDNSDPSIHFCNIRDNTNYGVLSQGGSNPTVTNNNIEGNHDGGVWNLDPVILVDATYNYWGDPSGPNHPSENPAGLGDAVSDYVEFVPWHGYAVGLESEFAPRTVELLQNYPNPFNPQTTILFTLDIPQRAEISVINLKGMLLSVLEDRTYSAGQHSVIWDGCNSSGHDMPSGTYVVRLRSESGEQAKKVMLVR